MFLRSAGSCNEEEEAHKVLCTSLESNPSLKTREIIYLFPDDMVCTNKYFNVGCNQNKLVSQIETTGRLMKQDTGMDGVVTKTVEITYVAKWELFVVGSEQHVESSASTEPSAEEKLASALNGMCF